MVSTEFVVDGQIICFREWGLLPISDWNDFTSEKVIAGDAAHM